MWGGTTRVENRGETTRGKRPGGGGGGKCLGAKSLVTVSNALIYGAVRPSTKPE